MTSKLQSRGRLPLADPVEFAPEILRLQASPPRPLPRVVLGVVFGLLTSILVWAAFSRLDVVAVAQGKLVPQTYLKIVQPAESGVVKEILVHDGQRVQAGQVLLRMDATLMNADLAALQAEYRRKSLALRRIDAELFDQPFEHGPDDPLPLFREVEAQYLANLRAQEAAIAEEQATWERTRQEMLAAQQAKEKLEETIAHYRQEDEAYQKLVKAGFVGRLAAGDKARERIEKEQDLHTQAFMLAREQADMARSERKITQLKTDYLRQLRNERAEVAEEVEQLREELAKQEHRQMMTELKAPQDALVKDLATHTAGTVAQAGTILMTLVPLSDTLHAEVWLSNEDVGFVRAGQPVKLKFAAFQFQKYGMLGAKVGQVAADATEQQERASASSSQPAPSAYRVLVDLDEQQLVADGVSHPLSPGMQVTAEIKLGERTVMEYLLSPIQGAFQEAGRER